MATDDPRESSENASPSGSGVDLVEAPNQPASGEPVLDDPTSVPGSAAAETHPQPVTAQPDAHRESEVDDDFEEEDEGAAALRPSINGRRPPRPTG